MTKVEKCTYRNKAKLSSFRQQIIPPVNLFEINFVLEAADVRVAIQDSPYDRDTIYTNSRNTRRKRSISFSLAKVVGNQGSRICLRHLGTDDRNDIWLMVDSDMIRPYPSGQELSVPLGFMNNHSVWNKMLTRVDKEEKMAPIEWFSPHPEDPGSNQFKVGEKLEAVDRRNAQLICPATISEIKGNFVLVSFDGWSGTFDYWASYNSQDLFPVGWCSRSKHKLQEPGPHYETHDKLIREYNNEYSSPSLRTLKRRPIENGTQKQQSSIRKRKLIKRTSKKPMKPNIDNDSDGTHVCDNDEDSRNRNRKISRYDPSTKNAKSETELKSNSFSNLFRLWTEKNALKTKKDIFEEKKKEDSDNCGEDNELERNDAAMLLLNTNNSDRSVLLQEKFGDCIAEDVITNKSRASPTLLFNQLTPMKPTSPSVINSSVANSIIEDYKCLSDTSGASYCAKIDEISSLIMNQSDFRKGLSALTNLPSDPCHWTIDDVQQYLINKNPTLESVAREFKNHEIDGQALLLLTMNTLRQYMKIKLGPAIKVEHIIRDLLDGKL